MDPQAELPYLFRPYEADDIAFIHNSWASSYYSGGGYNLYLDVQEFNYFHLPLRERFFRRPNAAVIVCASKEDPTIILGWIALERSKRTNILILCYLYIKQDFRRKGLGQELLNRSLPTRPVLVTHLTKVASNILDSHDEQFKDYYFTPHLV